MNDSTKETLRDVIAMSVFGAIYAEAFQSFREQRTGPPDENWRIELALDAYDMADAMLVARTIREHNK